jgi:hypothetical protein
MTSLSGAVLIFLAVIAGLVLMIFGFVASRDGLVIAGSILLGSVMIAGLNDSGARGSKTDSPP